MASARASIREGRARRVPGLVPSHPALVVHRDGRRIDQQALVAGGHGHVASGGGGGGGAARRRVSFVVAAAARAIERERAQCCQWSVRHCASHRAAGG
eukprot:SAG31_NODE_1277_length_9041_cov_22.545627_4_plen_98_part_00